MRVLMITGGFASARRQPWLMDDLASALADAGHQVDVVVGDTKSPRPRGEQRGMDPRITVFSAGTTKGPRRGAGRVLDHVGVGWGLHRRAFRWLRGRRYDLCIYTSPALFAWGLPGRLKRGGVTGHTLLFLWDFFPIHQLEIGRIRARRLGGLMKAVEWRAIAPADTVALMSPANVAFFHEYHSHDTNQRTVVIAPWAAAKPSVAKPPATAPLKVIFGGQIARGRGVDTLLAAAARLPQTDSPIQIQIAGDGPERAAMEDLARERRLSNVKFLGALPRERYREVARESHVGVAITVPGVSPPSFPSKIVEYCGLGLPVIVCVEESSDAGEILSDQHAGVGVPVGDDAALATALLRMLERLEDGSLGEMSAAATELFDSTLRVERVVGALERQLAR